MKLIQCKLMGEVDSEKCYNCYSNHLASVQYPSRVMCKQENVVEEISLENGIETQMELVAPVAVA